MSPEKVSPQNMPDSFDFLYRVIDLSTKFLEFLFSPLVILITRVLVIPQEWSLSHELND